jgi:hypothetical protein
VVSGGNDGKSTLILKCLPNSKNADPFSFAIGDSGESDLDINGDEDYSEDKCDALIERV